MNVGDLLRERDRLNGVIEEAKSARSKLKQINVLIAMYGDAANVDLVPVATNGARTPGGKPVIGDPVYCDVCDAGPFSGGRGAGTHKRRVHEGQGPGGARKAHKAAKK